MRRITTSLLALALALAPGGLTGCHGHAAPAPAPQGSGVKLVVQNRYFGDMDVYVVSEGLATRLGMVTSGTTASYTLDPSFFPSTDLRIVATPLGGNGRASSGPVLARPGQTITFTIAPVLRQSSVMVQ